MTNYKIINQNTSCIDFIRELGFLLILYSTYARLDSFFLHFDGSTLVVMLAIT
jgi:hypothetical protein